MTYQVGLLRNLGKDNSAKSLKRATYYKKQPVGTRWLCIAYSSERLKDPHNVLTSMALLMLVDTQCIT